MAATGFTPISLYYSTTAATAPSAGNLVAGELALNTLDEKLYFKNSAGTVKLLANSASSGTVTSVAATVPSIFSISGSPITSSGTLAMTYSGTTLPIANGGTNATATTCTCWCMTARTTSSNNKVFNRCRSNRRFFPSEELIWCCKHYANAWAALPYQAVPM